MKEIPTSTDCIENNPYQAGTSQHLAWQEGVTWVSKTSNNNNCKDMNKQDIEDERFLKTDYTTEQVAKDAAREALTRLSPKDFVDFMALVKSELVKGMQQYLISIEEETKSANALYEKLRCH